MALEGVRVLEMAGLAPVPFCGQILADFGADVVRVDRYPSPSPGGISFNRKKRSIALNLKHPEGIQALIDIASKADVFIDTWRPGVAEKLGVGPDQLMQKNPRLIYARLTGWGQNGSLSHAAGHDINYIAITGALAMLARKEPTKAPPTPPVNLLGDFAAGSLLCALGILMALIERQKSEKGQVIDSAMVDGTAYLATFIWKMYRNDTWSLDSGTNLLDTGAPFYDVYETKDGKYLSVGSLEPPFYALLLEGLGLSEDSSLPSQFDRARWSELRRAFGAKIQTKTQDEWTRIFAQPQLRDACVAPVLAMDEVMKFQHNRERSLVSEVDNLPAPAPRLSRTPARTQAKDVVDFENGSHSVVVLKEYGFSQERIQQLIDVGAIGAVVSKL